jgi:hypothetical protein
MIHKRSDAVGNLDNVDRLATTQDLETHAKISPPTCRPFEGGGSRIINKSRGAPQNNVLATK